MLAGGVNDRGANRTDSAARIRMAFGFCVHPSAFQVVKLATVDARHVICWNRVRAELMVLLEETVPDSDSIRDVVTVLAVAGFRRVRKTCH